MDALRDNGPFYDDSCESLLLLISTIYSGGEGHRLICRLQVGVDTRQLSMFGSPALVMCLALVFIRLRKA